MIIMVLTFILGTIFGVIGLISNDGVGVIRWIFSSENLLSSSPKILTDPTAGKYINICLNGNWKNKIISIKISRLKNFIYFY